MFQMLSEYQAIMFPKLSRPLLKNNAQVVFFPRGTALFLYRNLAVPFISCFLEYFQAASICGTVTFAGSSRDNSDSASAVAMSSGTC